MEYNFRELYDDDNDCELCGPSYAEGFELTDSSGNVVAKFEPVAHCTSPAHIPIESSLATLIQALGHRFGFKVNGLDNYLDFVLDGGLFLDSNHRP